MNPVEAISSVFRNYTNFSGRAPRSEFWWFTLFPFVSQIAFYFIPFVGWLYALALLLPSLAVTARRLHDTGRSAWWMLLYLVSVLGFTVAVSALIAVLAISVFGPRFGEEMDWGIFAILIGILLIVSVVSAIVLLIFLIMPGTPGPNRYGPDPVTQQQGTGAFGGEPPANPTPLRPQPVVAADPSSTRRRWNGSPEAGSFAPNAACSFRKTPGSAGSAARHCD